jgi:DNA-binding transcriptional MocR family regulator
MDEQGMDPDHLEQQLQKAHREFNLWQAHQQQAGVVNQDLQVNGAGPGHAMFPWSQQRDGLPPPTRPPSAIYLIPTGHNPTGITLSPERRARLYEVRGYSSAPTSLHAHTENFLNFS